MARIYGVRPFHNCLDQAVSFVYMQRFVSELIVSVEVDCTIASFLVKKILTVERNRDLTRSSRRCCPDDYRLCDP